MTLVLNCRKSLYSVAQVCVFPFRVHSTARDRLRGPSAVGQKPYRRLFGSPQHTIIRSVGSLHQFLMAIFRTRVLFAVHTGTHVLAIAQAAS